MIEKAKEVINDHLIGRFAFEKAAKLEKIKEENSDDEEGGSEKSWIWKKIMLRYIKKEKSLNQIFYLKDNWICFAYFYIDLEEVKKETKKKYWNDAEEHPFFIEGNEIAEQIK